MKNKSSRHWLIVFACCCNTLTAIGIIFNSIGIFFAPIADSLGVGRGDVAMFTTILNIFAGLAGPFIVRFISKDTIRKIMGAGVILVGGSLLILSRAQSLWIFYVLAPLMGIGQTMFSTLPVTIIIGNWFKEKIGLATGIAYSFSGLGGAVFNPLLNSIVQAYDWRIGFIVMGVCIIAFSLPGSLLLIRYSPDECGLLPYGASKPIVKSAPEKKNGKIKEMLAIAFTIQFIMIVVYAMCNSMMASITSHIPGFAVSIGLTAANGAALMTAIMIGNISSKLLIGVISDKIGPIRACSIMIGLSSCALAFFAFFPVPKFTVLFVVSVLFGTCASIRAVGTPLVVRLTFGNERYAVAYSTLTFVSSTLSSFMTSIIGYIYDGTGSYQIAFIACMIFGIVSLAFINIIGRRKQSENTAAR